MNNYTTEEFEDLKTAIHLTILLLNELQAKHIRETGREYVISGPLQTEKETPNANRIYSINSR